MKNVASYSGPWVAKCTLRPRRFVAFVSTFLSLSFPGWPHTKGKSVVRHFWWLLCLSRHPFNGKAVRGQRWWQQVSETFIYSPEYQQDSLNCPLYFTVNADCAPLWFIVDIIETNLLTTLFLFPHFFCLFFFCVCRAIIVRNNEVIPMTNEFTPESERQRLQYLVFLPVLHLTFYHHANR